MSDQKTLRDEIAIEVMGYLLQKGLQDQDSMHRGEVSRRAYKWADAMLKARSSSNE
jgi:hypothetical protein